MDRPKFLNPAERIRMTQNRLPHWEQDDCTYFLTFRLVDSLPAHLLDEWQQERKRWLQHHPEPWNSTDREEYLERFAHKREQWLDAGHGNCVLLQPELRHAAGNALISSGEVYVWALVIMPNHFHALVSLRDFRDGALGRLVRFWKGRSARAVNLARGKQGPLWAKDYFDRMIRNDAHFFNCARYIRGNPIKARLGGNAFSLVEHPWVKKRLDEAVP